MTLVQQEQSGTIFQAVFMDSLNQVKQLFDDKTIIDCFCARQTLTEELGDAWHELFPCCLVITGAACQQECSGSLQLKLH